MIRAIGLLMLSPAGGCEGCGDAPLVCPAAPTGSIPAGDANGDGRVDISDGVWLARANLHGGPPPVCAQAVDFLASGVPADLGDGVTVWSWLFAGTMAALPALPAGACAQAVPAAAPACRPVALALVAEDEVTSPFSVEIQLDAEGAEAWSYGVSARGCRVVGATTVPGLVGVGYDRTDVTGGHATGAVVLSWQDESTAAPGTVATLSVEAEVADTCVPCTLAFSSGLAGRGQPVDTVVTIEGASFSPTAEELEVEVCPR